MMPFLSAAILVIKKIIFSQLDIFFVLRRGARNLKGGVQYYFQNFKIRCNFIHKILFSKIVQNYTSREISLQEILKFVHELLISIVLCWLLLLTLSCKLLPLCFWYVRLWLRSLWFITLHTQRCWHESCNIS